MRSLILFVLIATAFAQETNYTVNCSTLSEPSTGCKSYNEMVLGKDKDILTQLQDANPAFVCFRPSEDVFFILSYRTPGDSDFSKVTSTTQEAWGYLYYSRYKGGILEHDESAWGKWIKYKGNEGRTIFMSTSKNTQGNISDSEVGIVYSFQNLTNTKTIYSVAVRRSTLRFLETQTWENTPPVMSKKQSAAQVPTEPTKDRIETTGYCAEFGSSAQ